MLLYNMEIAISCGKMFHTMPVLTNKEGIACFFVYKKVWIKKIFNKYFVKIKKVWNKKYSISIRVWSYRRFGIRTCDGQGWNLNSGLVTCCYSTINYLTLHRSRLLMISCCETPINYCLIATLTKCRNL